MVQNFVHFLFIKECKNNANNNINKINNNTQNNEVSKNKNNNEVVTKVNDQDKNKVPNVMIQGYKTIKQITSTLQGETIVAMDEKTQEMCAIKRASKNLYETHISINGHCINEDFLKEASILKLLSSCPNGPIGFIRFKELTEDKSNYYLIEEYGGIDLFDYVMQQNNKIKMKKLGIQQWQLKAQYIMRILFETVHYLHSKFNLCHLDLSLENILINSKTMVVKICDFGLSLIFPNDKPNGFHCFQYAGKSQYKSPEINQRIPFDARLADIWAIGVMLFIMLCGIPPFENAHSGDARFNCIMDGKLSQLIKLWKLEELIPEDAQDLLFQIFKPQNERISMVEILNHPYYKKSRQLVVDANHKNKTSNSSSKNTASAHTTATATTKTTSKILSTLSTISTM